MKILFLVIVIIQIIATNGKLLPLECSPGPALAYSGYYCNFMNQKSSNKDVSRIHVLPETYQGQPITVHGQEFHVSYSKCNFEHLPSVAYRFFQNLKGMYIDDSKIHEIKSSDFINAALIKKVTFKNSKIGSIGERAFEWMSSVEEIILENCEIGEIHEDAFYGAKSLKKVTFKGNSIDMSKEPELRMPNRKVIFIDE